VAAALPPGQTTIATAIRIADEFGYDLVIDHGTEAHLLADLIAARGTPVIIGPLFTSRSKVRAAETGPWPIPVAWPRAGVTIAITTDHPVVPINFLVHQASLAVKDGLDREKRAAGAHDQPGEDRGNRRPARLDRTGQGRPTLLSGRATRLDVLSRAVRVFVDGAEIYSYAGGGGAFLPTSDEVFACVR